MRRYLPLTAIVGALLVAAPAAQSPSRSDSLERAFVAGGRISIDLTAGSHRIEASPDDRIRLEWRVRDDRDLRRVRASIDVDGTDARVRLDGPSENFRATIAVPRRSNLSVRLSAGELRVEAIVGHKDLRLNAGELDVDVGDPADYGHVEGSVWAGEVQAGPFRINKGGLFRSFDWRGDGEYRLRARLLAGEIRLFSSSGDTVSRAR